MLKLIAFILMTIDHMAWLWPHIIPYQVSYILRLICRLAFPLFVYDCVLGLRRTRSIPKYLSRLAILAVISQICIHLCYVKLNVTDFEGFVNIFFSLFFGLIFIMAIDLLLACLLRLKVIKSLPFELFHYKNFKLWHGLLNSLHSKKKSTLAAILFFSLVIVITCPIIVFIIHCDYSLFGLILFVCLHYLVYAKGAFSAELSQVELKNKVPAYILYLAIVFGIYLGIADYLLPRLGVTAFMFGDLQTCVIFSPYFFPLAAKSKKPKRWLSRLLYFYYPLHLVLISIVRYLTI